jgi:hypothetical protein
MSGSRASSDRAAETALAALGAELLRRADESAPALAAAWDELMAQWGIAGEPVGVKRLREMIREETRRTADDNEFSRELIARREDRRP